MEFNDETRRAICMRLGLSQSTAWDRLMELQRETNRISYCLELGLPITSSWTEIKRYRQHKHRPSEAA